MIVDGLCKDGAVSETEARQRLSRSPRWVWVALDKEYATALLPHDGEWGLPKRRQAADPAPKPRWMPLPHLLYAQVLKTVRRRRLVRGTHRVVFGTLATIEQVLAAQEWQSNTAFIEVQPVGRKEALASG